MFVRVCSGYRRFCSLFAVRCSWTHRTVFNANEINQQMKKANKKSEFRIRFVFSFFFVSFKVIVVIAKVLNATFSIVRTENSCSSLHSFFLFCFVLYSWPCPCSCIDIARLALVSVVNIGSKFCMRFWCNKLKLLPLQFSFSTEKYVQQ